MPTDKPNYFVITGGPGAGKTAIIESLRDRGYATVGEAGRAAGGGAEGGVAERAEFVLDRVEAWTMAVGR